MRRDFKLDWPFSSLVVESCILLTNNRPTTAGDNHDIVQRASVLKAILRLEESPSLFCFCHMCPRAYAYLTLFYIIEYLQNTT